MAVTISILGSTGSVGTQTLDIIQQHKEAYQVIALSCHKRSDLLFEQCQLFKPQYVVCVDAAAAAKLRTQLKAAKLTTAVLEGAGALVELAADAQADVVVAAVVGAAGLPATYAAVKAGKRVLLANKEALVMSGALLMDALAQSDAVLLPVDSEHNALFQCMPAGYVPGQGRPAHVAGLVLTASGGPFLNYPLAEFERITQEQAVAHPNWSMGAKISVDSATMMNKGLEVIEAHWLFDMPLSDIEVVIHPQSIVHSLLRYVDGSVLAECGVPDMRTPIAHCLAWPERMAVDVAQLDLLKVGRFDFIAPDYTRFPCLKLAYQALAAGPAAMIVLNVANEVAVDAFLKGQIRYTDIAAHIERCLSEWDIASPRCIEDVIEIERELRLL